MQLSPLLHERLEREFSRPDLIPLPIAQAEAPLESATSRADGVEMTVGDRVEVNVLDNDLFVPVDAELRSIDQITELEIRYELTGLVSITSNDDEPDEYAMNYEVFADGVTHTGLLVVRTLESVSPSVPTEPIPPAPPKLRFHE